MYGAVLGSFRYIKKAPHGYMCSTVFQRLILEKWGCSKCRTGSQKLYVSVSYVRGNNMLVSHQILDYFFFTDVYVG